ncbi:hypothetical protein LZ575_16210 [Antarcticibacterium sp. 1MA-6-2]|uniref:hypothetical protein n=1 Tax=Antarcticibacterium sp. 1MA-6-2 TaxID=2908210 RepID=UPI001F3CF971|nr:hypothetical protein [Antarcticibacterium sp. 1MA-6-2]UJH90369.1 hypothetical protein LZ575_16210 [Antarcticibacterium sp. 1MA-6-2]
MKRLFYILIAICMCYSTSAEAQLLGKLKKGVQNAAERAVVKKAEDKVTKETEKAMDGVLDPNAPKEETTEVEESSNQTSNEPNVAAAVPASKEAKLWSKYNFVPGDEIIFEDNLAREENGEFPSRWDLLQGNAENASLDGE